MKDLGNARASLVVVDEAHGAQRLDNFLLRELKGVPRSRVYRLLRGGEVRVNSRRADAAYRLRPGDRVRIPPVRRRAARRGGAPAPKAGFRTLFEDEALLVVDKPAGVAVHGGSGVSFGVIERLRAERPGARFLELVHRLDRETSGVLVLAKKRPALVALHAALREGKVSKRYLALVKGNWIGPEREVILRLGKRVTATGERRVRVEEGGRVSRTRFRLKQRYRGFSLLEATLDTGRTHQIRVQLAHLGLPIAGDDKYGDFELNRRLARLGLRRMFLHAAELGFVHPLTGARIELVAPLPEELARFLDRLRGSGADAEAL